MKRGELSLRDQVFRRGKFHGGVCSPQAPSSSPAREHHSAILLQADCDWLIYHCAAAPLLPKWLSSKESVCSAGDTGLIPGWRRSPGEGNSNPLQYSCLENPTDRGTWRTTVQGVSKNQTQQSDLAHLHTFYLILLNIFSAVTIPFLLLIYISTIDFQILPFRAQAFCDSDLNAFKVNKLFLIHKKDNKIRQFPQFYIFIQDYQKCYCLKDSRILNY